MELGLWGTLWANCALGTTFFALPTLPILNTGTEDSLAVDDDSHRQDHETQTVGLSFSDSEGSVTQDQPEELEETNESVAEVQNNCSTSDSNSVQSIPESSIVENTVDIQVLVGEEKQKKTSKKKSKSFQRNRYSREEYRCTICPYTCTTERAFLRHLRSHSEAEDNDEVQGKQSQGTPRLSCPVCGKDRSGEPALNKHMLRHRDQDKNLCCDICSFKTVQLKKLIQHRRMHTGERPHLCPHCVYRAARRDNLRSHVRRVHKRDNLTCDTFSPRGMLLVPSNSNSSNVKTATAAVADPGEHEPNQEL